MPAWRLVVFVPVFLAALELTHPAYAYLDPGTGSILLQLLLGGVAGGLVICKLYWHRLKSMFGLSKAQDSQKTKN